MIISFTGTQTGLTANQITVIIDLLMLYQPIEVHHGDCVGADAQFNVIANKLHIPTVVHPPTDNKKRAFCTASVSFRYPCRPYLERNKAIVYAGSMLIAGPGLPEYLRSGTWSTVRYARKQKKRIIIVEP